MSAVFLFIDLVKRPKDDYRNYIKFEWRFLHNFWLMI